MAMDQRMQRQQASSSPQVKRKIFNCIVDDSALVAGVKRSTRNGLRQWIKNSQIRLFVPSHALEQLSLQKSGDSRYAEDVRETLDWLDEATTRYPDAVTLQGGDDTFEEWSEVQKFVVPRSLFSEDDHVDMPSSPDDSKNGKTSTETLEKRLDNMELNDGASVPLALQPLFNYILWRIHQEVDPKAALESFIFLCNDPAKVALAKGFEVRCKRLEQLRDAIAREDKEAKARQPNTHRPSQSSISSLPDEFASPKRSPPTMPAAMTSPQATSLMDPDTFGRSPIMAQAARGARGGRGSMRGRGRAGALASPKLGRAEAVFNAGRGRSEMFIEAGPEIDPNSFERPRGGHLGRGGRRLWTPG